MKRNYQKTTRNTIFNKYYKRAAPQTGEEVSNEDEHNYSVKMYSTVTIEKVKSPIPSSRNDCAIRSSIAAIDPTIAISDEACYIGDSDHSTSSSNSVGFHVSESEHFVENNIEEISLQHFDSEEGMTMKSRLVEWALKHNITHSAINDLLTILKQSFSDIPLDARTLLKTPRNTILETVEPGSYCHFGFKKCLQELLTHSYHLLQDLNLLEVCINIDGLPLSKSSGTIPNSPELIFE